ncbi:Intracellular protein transport protein-like protein [Emericellopsis cladophorae]|uniref:Intracellular protein transport protein-like protein n=1 Tax=Emericellopsis cladophorae TaxID=2686198 RepID=A0A9P9XZD2_9HYPO|nr:Intracellular protein transport protein-like protein [Emericellopsis cladophorae]KAI6780303.1 Intracellular protein transport protein-like protein [Emericellopsis cladophorae]
MFSTISTAPAKQSVSETISTLSSRLSSATLLEDRRAAILGLRSFAKDYPASVSSGALRSLIGSLNKDGEDVDTVKVVLETLLMLFNPNADSPEASDEVALWMADEFTQRAENITLLLDFLENNDFYGRLYSLQLLAAISNARAERTKECIFTAPSGIPRLVAALDDQREAVRNEAVTLLIYLTHNSIDIQKLVAFENAFDRIFNVVAADGSLAEGGRSVEDCFILLVNLLRRNKTNQSLFRESGCIAKLAELLAQLLEAQSQEPEIAEWALAQRNRNLYAFLAVVRLFLTGSKGTAQNQAAFWKQGLAFSVLQLAFSHEAHATIKGEALVTVGDLIRSNASMQETFAQLMVTAPLQEIHDNDDKTNGHAKVYVIDGLLDLTLSVQDLGAFDVRFAACECLKAYFSNHAEVKAHFLSRAIEGHQSGNDEVTNVLTVLLNPAAVLSPSDPYRLWFAAVIAFHLLYDNPIAKSKASALTEGDAENGEEVVTSIQTVAAHLVAGLRRDDDPRILVGYLMLLLGWLYEDIDAVNDFLSEGSNIQSLIQAILQPVVSGGDLVQGLCTMLLGVAYEFSTRDSPIPRATLQTILLSRLDRDTYHDRLNELRSHPLVRDFEVIPQKADESGTLPEVFLDSIFVNFLKDNCSRITRCIDREPGLEISVINNGVQKGISRELVDSLRAQLSDKDKALEDAQLAVTALENQLGQEKTEHRRAADLIAVDLNKAKEEMTAMAKAHEAELRKLQTQHTAKDAAVEKQMEQLRSQISAKEADLQRQLAARNSAFEKQSEQLKNQHAAKEAELQKKLAAQQAEVEKKLKAQQTDIEKKHKAQQAESEKKLTTQISEKDKELSKLREQLKSKDTELDEKVAQVKKTAETEAERLQRRTEAEVADLKATISRLEVDLMKANKTKSQELQALKDEHTKALANPNKQVKEAEAEAKKLNKKIKDLETKMKDLECELEEAHKASDTAGTKARKAESEKSEAIKAKDSTQSELDDLLMVFGDLEEKVAKYKARLRELGETVSDGEDDEDGSDDSDVD